MKKLFAIACLLTFAAVAYADELAVGAKAPGFTLVDAKTGQNVSFKPGDGKLSVVVFTCNGCPYAKAFEPRIVELAKQYQAKGVAFYALNPNDEIKFPVETLGEMKTRSYPFPYLKDADSAIAHAYGARVTPHIFVVDKTGTVRYRGYVDDSAKPEERKTTGLTNALDDLLANREVANSNTRAFGCSIKFKS
ncbi:MAG: thioredoxin family protein [Acidobacteria bacterium]|nr:thioredoxin family protein [Acidobacteriota bacterium]